LLYLAYPSVAVALYYFGGRITPELPIADRRAYVLAAFVFADV
jgi:hypothetical protein